MAIRGRWWRYGLVLGALGLGACDPATEPADGAITVFNDSTEPLVVTFDFGEPGHEPDLEQMWQRRRRLRSAAPGTTSYATFDTYLGADGQPPWCLDEWRIIVLLRPVDGQPVDDVITPEDQPYDWTDFEIVDWYGPGYCVDSDSTSISYSGRGS